MKKYVAIAARPGHLLPWTLLRDAELAMALVYGVVPQRTHRGSGVVERGFRMGVIPNLDGAKTYGTRYLVLNHSFFELNGCFDMWRDQTITTGSSQRATQLLSVLRLACHHEWCFEKSNLTVSRTV